MLLLMIILMPMSFSSCGCFTGSTWYGTGDWVQKIDAPEIVHVIQNYLAYLRHEKHLRLEDSGVYYNDYINAIRMEFICMDLLEVREARMLLVDLVEGLLVEMNKNPVLTPNSLPIPSLRDNWKSISILKAFMAYITMLIMLAGSNLKKISRTIMPST